MSSWIVVRVILVRWTRYYLLLFKNVWYSIFWIIPECQDLLHKIIVPRPVDRIPLLDMEIHSWVTEGGKKQFVPFLSFPKDKNMRSQVSWLRVNMLLHSLAIFIIASLLMLFAKSHLNLLNVNVFVEGLYYRYSFNFMSFQLYSAIEMKIRLIRIQIHDITLVIYL